MKPEANNATLRQPLELNDDETRQVSGGVTPAAGLNPVQVYHRPAISCPGYR